MADTEMAVAKEVLVMVGESAGNGLLVLLYVVLFAAWICAFLLALAGLFWVASRRGGGGWWALAGGLALLAFVLPFLVVVIAGVLVLVERRRDRPPTQTGSELPPPTAGAEMPSPNTHSSS